MQNLVQHWGWNALAHPSYSPDLTPCDYWLFEHVKEHLRGQWIKSEDDINTAITASLHRLSKEEHKAAIDCLPHRRDMCVGEYIE